MHGSYGPSRGLLRPALLSSRPGGGTAVAAAIQGQQRFPSASSRLVGGAAATLCPADSAAALHCYLAAKLQQDSHEVAHG